MLDLGCGHQFYRSWRRDEEESFIKKNKNIFGLDYDFFSLINHRTITNRARGEIAILPFKSGSFDVVLCNMVVEHLENPEIEFKEANRILGDNGVFIFHTPNAFSFGTIVTRCIPERIKGPLIKLLDGRDEEDVFQTYYRSNTYKQISKIALEAGFDVEEFKLILEPVARFASFTVLGISELIIKKIFDFVSFGKFRTNIICKMRKASIR